MKNASHDRFLSAMEIRSLLDELYVFMLLMVSRGAFWFLLHESLFFLAIYDVFQFLLHGSPPFFLVIYGVF
jgi:hypothetical protein